MPEMKCDSMNLNNESDTIKFYDDRYSKGYMEEWPIEKNSGFWRLLRV